LIRARIIFIALLLIGLGGKAPAESADGTVTLAAVGDVFFARGVAHQIELHGTDYPFEFTSDILSRFDLAFCNLECALSTRGTPRVKRYLFRADPSSAFMLSNAGFDIVSVANNHTLDFGPEALRDTVDAIEGAGMIAVGARVKGSDDSGVKVVEKNGLKVGFLALSDFDAFDEETPEGLPVVMGVDAHRLAGQVADAKTRCDVLIVSMHWGIDYLNFWTERQQKIAEICIDSGADLILGHHPHVQQDVGMYKGRPIVYSMGAFLWDSTSRGADLSAIYVFVLSPGSAVLLEKIPARIVGCRPIL
jgi:poly-gamma-glutamate synthesis protein (capsule biosynthesis protein)